MLVVSGAALALALTGCGGTSTGPDLGKARLVAAEALAASANKAAEVTSYRASVVVDVRSKEHGPGNVRGTVLYQQKPAVAADVNLNQVTMNGTNLPGGARLIVRDNVAYVKSDLLKMFNGGAKPWLRVDLAQAAQRAGYDLNTIIAQVQRFDLAANTKMITTSKDAREVGKETVGGVETTHYAGTIDVPSALPQVDERVRAKLERALKEVKDAKFDVWVDAQGLPRKITLTGTAQEGTMTATALLNDFNKPVNVVAPPANQVGELPRVHPVPPQGGQPRVDRMPERPIEPHAS
ncbi:DUF1396 domain-containing protein [Bailinhaonella thermotolerans]|uniref:DUF1396 domain-containing protein n=1 Tax=Bailinhaonella thermotolerans TaxID=1070861 RepID=A0A3A4ATW6_9ACTN|nr:DUF1396 domain-containing protein [Bailinhaonella thermotolerans]